ncbi:hypothetical protein C8R44DRAFT_889540 [Mycena epipterygia]|nr:hypothetical protein C8R44DRAFT_889540 [Mycena epipterygia]
MSESVQIAKSTLPVFIGTAINWGLSGVLVAQVCIYFTAFPNDRTFSRLLVVSVLIVEIMATIANTRDSIIIFGSGWGNPVVLEEPNWGTVSVPVSGAITACIGQTFFAWRIHIIGQRLYIPVLIIFCTVVQLVAGIWVGVLLSLSEKFPHLLFLNVPSTATWLAATSLCDLILVSGTVYYLVILRSPEIRGTNALVTRIIKITIETGLFCAIFALVNLYLFLAYKETSYELAVRIELSKIYSNSMLLILNSRAHIGHASSSYDIHHYSLNISVLCSEVERPEPRHPLSQPKSKGPLIPMAISTPSEGNGHDLDF